MTAERRYSPPKSGERLRKLSGDREMSADPLSAVRRAGKQKIVLKGGCLTNLKMKLVRDQ